MEEGDRPTTPLADAIAQCCHDTFRKLPKHGKPTRKHNGQLEWTVIAAIVMATPTTTVTTTSTATTLDQDYQDHSWDLQCLSLATGSKCLPRGKQSPFGDRLNDCHAEVLARRGFNLWCLKQMQACLDAPGNETNPFELVRHDQASDPCAPHDLPPFKWRNDQARLYLYVSQAPCGDATTESLAQIQTEESKAAFYTGRDESTTDANRSATVTTETTIQTDPTTGSKHNLANKHSSLQRSKIQRTDKCPDLLDLLLASKEASPLDTTNNNEERGRGCMSLAFRRGRLDYGCITALRTKPGRVDSEPTLSMSCSDKMARWNVLGLTSALVVSLLDRPLYLDAIVSHELFDADALHRALYARIEQAAASGDRRRSTSTLEKEIKERKEEQEKGNVDHENDDQQDQQDSIYHLHRPKIWYTSQVFEFSKEAVCGLADQEQQQQQQQSSSSSDIVAPSRPPPPPPTASPNGMSWTAGLPVEVIVNGCKAGASAKQSSATRPLPEKSQSRLCKSQLYSTSLRLWKQVAVHREEGGRGVGGGDMTGTKSYQTWKQQIAPAYQKAKTRLLQGVMRHWVKGLSELEQFDDHGSIVPSSHETSHGG